MNQRICVIAVLGVEHPAILGHTSASSRHVAEAIVVRVGIPHIAAHQRRIVHHRVAVIVYAITGLDGVGMNGRVAIITIPRFGDIGRARGCAGDHRIRGVAPAVGVAIGVSGGDIDGRGLVNHAITIVVNPIAALRGFGRDTRGGVIAVAGLLNIGGAGLGAAIDRHNRVTIAILVAVIIPGDVTLSLVDAAIAVVVDPVADLRRLGGAGGVLVIAVPLLLAEAVVVVVLKGGEAKAIEVFVQEATSQEEKVQKPVPGTI